MFVSYVVKHILFEINFNFFVTFLTIYIVAFDVEKAVETARLGIIEWQIFLLPQQWRATD